ncbi:hypothetical protein HDF13_001025 [Edaphobacter lichenicola]|uniref:Uncharacterized protein n=1 Tax=Tunturiibacter gelidiferens TaxID=3069689 RepID=A0ACC5NVS7_9BACT|nr:hypothetical protein [Edaphobacter lichenicola]
MPNSKPKDFKLGHYQGQRQLGFPQYPVIH